MPMLAEPLCGQLAVFTEGGDELGGFFGRDLRPEPCGAASRPDEMATIEVHDLGLVEAVHRVVLGLDDAGTDLFDELGNTAVHDLSLIHI